MPPQRPAKQPSSSSSSASFIPPALGPLSGIAVHIIQPKLAPSDVAELYDLAEQLGARLVNDITTADVVVTAIGMRTRLERHISWGLAQTKDIVTPEWLRESARQRVRLSAQLFPAIRARPLSTKRKTPPSSSQGEAPRSKASRPSEPAITSATLVSPALLERFLPTARYAVQRIHPLICSNQALVKELAVIRRSRELEGEERSALSYMRAISAIKAHPREIKSLKEAEAIPFVGAKIVGMVEEFLKRGYISESEELRASPRYNSLCELTRIHGIGPTRAREFFSKGLRTLDELDRYYGVVVPDGFGNWIRNENLGEITQDEGGMESIICEALALRDELSQSIPRAEVERIARAVAEELESIEPGCLHTVCGGYRRGKPESNDIDIVITHPEARRVRGLCTRLVAHLKARGLVSRSWSHNQTFDNHGSKEKLKSTPSLDKSLVLLRLPPNPLARRVDLVFAPPPAYWTAVVGWTGSIMFERDLRLWVKDRRGLKFNDSGLTQRANTVLLPAQSEEEVFSLCGLEYIDPIWRNADL